MNFISYEEFSAAFDRVHSLHMRHLESNGTPLEEIRPTANRSHGESETRPWRQPSPGLVDFDWSKPTVETKVYIEPKYYEPRKPVKLPYDYVRNYEFVAFDDILSDIAAQLDINDPLFGQHLYDEVEQEF